MRPGCGKSPNAIGYTKELCEASGWRYCPAYSHRGIFGPMFQWRGVLFAIVLFGMAPSAGNAFYIRVYGLVTEHFTGDPMKGVQVRLVKDSIERETVVTVWNGKYELYLERGYEYQIWFHRPDLVTKHVVIDAREVPLFPDVPFYEMDLQMTLFEWFDGFDFSAFDMPLGMAAYKHSVRNLQWNTELTQGRQRQVARVMINYERFLAAKQKAAKAAASKPGSTKKRRTVAF